MAAVGFLQGQEGQGPQLTKGKIQEGWQTEKSWQAHTAVEELISIMRPLGLLVWLSFSLTGVDAMGHSLARVGMLVLLALIKTPAQVETSVQMQLRT